MLGTLSGRRATRQVLQTGACWVAISCGAHPAAQKRSSGVWAFRSRGAEPMARCCCGLARLSTAVLRDQQAAGLAAASKSLKLLQGSAGWALRPRRESGQRLARFWQVCWTVASLPDRTLVRCSAVEGPWTGVPLRLHEARWACKAQIDSAAQPAAHMATCSHLRHAPGCAQGLVHRPALRNARRAAAGARQASRAGCQSGAAHSFCGCRLPLRTGELWTFCLASLRCCSAV